MEKRKCSYCHRPLDPMAHGNQRMHPECAYLSKMERQKNKYQIGDTAKLKIQKNDKILAQLHKQDSEKQGFPYLPVLENGLKINCTYTERNRPYVNGSIYKLESIQQLLEENIVGNI